MKADTGLAKQEVCISLLHLNALPALLRPRQQENVSWPLFEGSRGTVVSCLDCSPAGFICPFVPALPLASILFNVYLLVNLG